MLVSWQIHPTTLMNECLFIKKKQNKKPSLNHSKLKGHNLQTISVT
jgi:hypothetical protein